MNFVSKCYAQTSGDVVDTTAEVVAGAADVGSDVSFMGLSTTGLTVLLVTVAVVAGLCFWKRIALRHLYVRTVAFVKEVRREMAFITWPTRDEIKDSTKIVFVTVFALAIYIFVLDLSLTKVFSFIMNLF